MLFFRYLHKPNGVDSWQNIYGEIPINQDQVTSLAIWLAGNSRFQTMVNRAIHITKLDEFDEDGSYINFCLGIENAQ